MSTTTSLRSRVELTSLSAWLAVGDAAALTVFFTIGEKSHGYQPFANPSIIAEGVAPFLLAWLLAAAVTGLYSAEAISSPRTALTVTVPAWVLGALAGHGLRATELFRGDTAWTFMLVSLAVGGLLLVGWRVLLAAAYSPE